MTSLNSRNGVSRGGIAVPGEVRRWRRPFALLAVAASRKPDPRQASTIDGLQHP
jgi:hypothetical protein